MQRSICADTLQVPSLMTKLTLLLALALVIYAQPKSTPKPLKFEVASIHPNTSGSTVMGGGCRGSESISRPPGLPSIGETAKGNIPIREPALGRCQLTNVTLLMLIQRAYNLGINGNGKITGGPKWIDSDRFDIEAAAPNPTKVKEAQLYSMLQKLLADRFQLKVHYDKSAPVKTLVIDSAEHPSEN